jgi:predicted amidohydrolase YtcJ
MRQTITWSAVLWVLTAAAGAAAGEPAPGAPQAPADIVFLNGSVVTLDPLAPRASALAVRDGRIVAVGDEAAVRPLVGPKTRSVELGARAVFPGFTDAHVHVEGLGQALEQLDLVGTASLDEALRKVAAAARALPPGEWLLGRGWDQNDWPDKRFPTAADLDRVAPDRPVLLERIDGHAAWANGRALALAGVTAATADPPGGRLLRDARGAPSGVLVDAAQGLIESRVPAPTREARKRRLERGLQACAQAGLTEVHDAGVDLDTIALYKELLAEGRLGVRVYAMLRGPEDFLAMPATLEPEIGLGDGRLTVRAIKVVADGALGSRGALLLQPYSDEPGTKGLATVDPARLRELLKQALARGFQVNTHAIGDGANRLVLDAYAEAFGAGGGAARRWRIEHAQVIAPEDVPRFKALGVIPSVQPTHCTSDMYWAEARLGPERAQGAYLWKTFLRQGVPVAGGSDAPVEKIDLLPGLYAAVTRRDAQGWPAGG